MRQILLLLFIIQMPLLGHANLVVHEWGTFTSLMDSEGKSQPGMYQEDELLPDFVHNFGESSFLKSVQSPPPRDPAPSPQPSPQPCHGHPKVPCDLLANQIITQKMETPVVYFYSEVPQKVSLDVTFPKGIISQSYPAPFISFPPAKPGVPFKNGFARYDLNVLGTKDGPVPPVAANNIYGHARKVKSSLIQSGNEMEKFVFYRGLGEFNTEVKITSHQGALRLKNKGDQLIPAAFLINIDQNQKGFIKSIGKIPSMTEKIINAGEIDSMKEDLQTSAIFLKAAREQLLKALTKAGLYQDEALAMINTWESGYFKTPGLRILYILSREEVDSILPLAVTPAPESLQRVFVGRIEILLDTEEEQLLNTLLHEKAEFDVNSLGRLALPILERLSSIAISRKLMTPELENIFTILKNKIP